MSFKPWDAPNDCSNYGSIVCCVTLLSYRYLRQSAAKYVAKHYKNSREVNRENSGQWYG